MTPVQLVLDQVVRIAGSGGYDIHNCFECGAIRTVGRRPQRLWFCWGACREFGGNDGRSFVLGWWEVPSEEGGYGVVAELLAGGSPRRWRERLAVTFLPGHRGVMGVVS